MMLPSMSRCLRSFLQRRLLHSQALGRLVAAAPDLGIIDPDKPIEEVGPHLT